MSSESHQTGRRAAPRLRLSLPGTFLGVRATMRCIVINMSQTGVQMATEDRLKPGENGYLRCGPLDHFMTVMRVENGLVALEFDRPIAHDLVMQIRAIQETIAESDEVELMEAARSWVQGAAASRR